MDDSNVQTFDPSFFGGAPSSDVPGAQDRSTPLDSSMADLADQATQRLHAGEDPDVIQADLGRQMQTRQDKAEGKGKHDVTQGGVSDKNVASFDPSFFGMAAPRASELTSQYQPVENWSGQVYNSPNSANAQPDAFTETGSQVQGVGDYLENLGTYAAEGLRKAYGGAVQDIGEIPQMGRDIAAKFGTFTGGVQGGVPPSAVFTAAAQAQGAPADNALATAGQFEAEKGQKAQEQAATHLLPAPDENTGGLGQAAYYTQQALAGAPTVAAAMAAGPVGGAALFGAQTAGEQYAQKRAAGEAPLSAAASSGIEGAVSALTASLSLDSALSPGAIGALRRIAETTGSVEAQSVINEATSIAAEQTIDGKDISADEIKARLIGAAKGGIPAGVLMGGIGAVAAHDPAAAAAANVERLAANLAPEAVRPTLEERVNAREIPQDQGGVPGQGIVEEGGREGGGADIQRTAQAGAEAGDAGRPVAGIVDVDLSKFMSPAEVAKLEAAGLATDGRITNRADLVAATKIISADRAQEAPNVDQNVQPAGAERAGPQEDEGTQGAEAPEVATAPFYALGEGGENEISTRNPTAKKATENPITDRLNVGIESAMRDPEALAHNINLMRQYPEFGPEDTHEDIVNHMARNLTWLHDQVPSEIRARAHLWYDGANKIAQSVADQYGIERPGVSGVMAALSPQKDWFMNASLGRRVIDTLSNHANDPWSPEMDQTAQRIFGKEQYAPDLAEIRGKQLSDLTDPYLRAMWVRTYDEAHNPRDYPVIHPEGDQGEFAKTGSGERRKVAWGSLGEASKAVSIFDDPSRENISRMLGDQHKVRSFYNNIESPNSPNGHTTIDTHAVAAAHLRPLSGAATEVTHNFGGAGTKNSSITGNQGTYGIYHEAYQRAAEARGILPREMQSITWEGIRSLFPAALKRNPKIVAEAHQTWDNFRQGRITENEARDHILQLAGGIRDPEWLSSARPHEGPGAAADAGDVSEPQLPGRSADETVAGTRGGSAAAVPDVARYQREQARHQSDNLSRDQARDALVKEFGATAVRKLEANGLNLVPREALLPHTQELTEGQRATVKGFTPADRSSANVVHDNVTRAELPNTAIHEVVHANLDRILPEATRNALASAIQARGRTSPEVKAALDKIPKTTPKAVYREEVLGQVMGDLYNQPIGRRVMDAFKLGLNRVGVPLDWMNAHEAAIRQIGIENLRHYAEAPRRAPAMTVQLAAPTAPAVAGEPRKPTVRMTPEQLAERMARGGENVQRGEADGRGVPAGDVGDNAGTVRENERETPPTTAGAPNAADTGVREPDVRATDEGGVVREPTSIKNAVTTAERAARDLGPIETQLGNDFGENNDQAKARLDASPTHGEELAAELAANPRPHTDVESAVLLRDRVRLQNEHAEAMKRAETAMDSGDEQEHLRARATAAQIEARLQLNEEAAKHSGSATARGLNARRAMMNEDYSLARILTRARVLNGGDIAPEQRAIFEDLARRIAANDAVGPEAPAKTARKARTPAEKRSLDDEFSSLAAELKKLTQPKASEALFARVEDPKVAAVLRKMAKNRSDSGETDPLKIVDALHDAVGENIPKEDIADTISGYGTTRKPTQDELTTRYNAIKRELADLSRTQDTLSGKIDPNAAKDRARQTALRTEIEGLDRRINYRDAVAPERTKPEYSAATQALKAKRDELAQEVRNLEPSPPTTRPLDQNEVKNKAQRSALQRDIDDLDRRIAAKQTEATPRRPFTADAETKNLRALRDAKKRELENLKPSPAATKPEDPRVKRNDIRQKQLQREIADIKSRLQRKDYSRPERQKPVYDAKTTELAAQRAELARRVESELEKIRQQSKSKVERIVDLGLNIRRAVILSSVKTLGKLTGAATERIGFDPIEELAGGFLGHVPGLRGIAAGAPIEGRFSGHAVAEGLRHTFNAESRQAAMQKLKTGLDNLDLTFGNKRDYERSHTWLDYVGQLHGALKTPAKYNRFYSSLAKYAQWERARVIGEGMTPAQADAHMQDPVTIAMMGGKAYENANRSIFMQDNAAVTAYKVMLGYLSKAGAEGSMTRAFSKTAEKVGRYLVPIVRIPTNFVAESGSYGLGAAKALGQVIAAKGVENLTSDQKDYVMRNLKKQTVGAALMYLGYMGAGSIGGYYQQGDNKKTLKNAPGDITIGGVTVPRFLIHNPAMEMVQIGATIRRVAEARARKDEYPMASGALEAGKGLLSEVPFFDAPQRIGNAVTNIKTLGKYLGGEVRSSFIPPDVQNAARMLDNDKKRSPQNFTQELEMGVPGLRPNVPQTKTR